MSNILRRTLDKLANRRMNELESALREMVKSCPLCNGNIYVGQREWMCSYCGAYGKTHDSFVHDADCPWARAKALLDETENT